MHCSQNWPIDGKAKPANFDSDIKKFNSSVMISGESGVRTLSHFVAINVVMRPIPIST